MPIDPNIALGFRPVEQPNMLGQYGQIMAIKAAQQEMEGYEGVKNALAGGMEATDPRLLQYGKRGIDAFKAAGEGKIKQLEAGKKQSELLGNIFGGVIADPSSGPVAVQQLVKMGVLSSEQAQQTIAQAGNDPAKWKELASPYYQQSIDATKRFQDETERWKATMQNETTQRGQNMSYGAQVRGQNMTAGTAANRLAFDQEKVAWERANPGYEIKEGENGNIFGINKRTLEAFPVNIGASANKLANPATPSLEAPAAAAPAGAPSVAPSVAPNAAPVAAATPVAPATAASPVQLKGKGTALTEAQGKATGFASRATEANDILNTVGNAGKVQTGAIKRVAESVPFVGEGLGTLTNFTQSPQQQQVEQAQRNFVNAILRQESGAAINESEFNNAKKQYFPQPGDSAEVIAQKQRNRETAIASLNAISGPGAKSVSPGGPKIGTVEDGYKYNGGNPGDPKNWSKVD